MRVLVTHPYMKSLGGGEWLCLNVLEALLEEGHEVILLTGKLPESELADIFNFRVGELAILQFKPFKPRFRFAAYQWLLWHYYYGRSLMRRLGRVDVEFSTQDVAFNFRVGRVKVAYVHFPYFKAHLYPGRAPNKLTKLYYGPIVRYWRRHLKSIDLVLCNSEFTMSKVWKLWGKKGIVVYPPVDVEFFKPESLREDRRKDLVVSIGRITPVKNFELVLHVARAFPEMEFLIAGTTADMNYYCRLLEAKPANVQILPDIKRMRLRQILQHAKVYLHPMVGEHFGISVVEAMAAGCIPVVHNSGGVREIVKGVGYLYNDAEECMIMIKRALENSVRREKIVNRSRLYDRRIFKENIKSLIGEAA